MEDLCRAMWVGDPVGCERIAQEPRGSGDERLAPTFSRRRKVMKTVIKWLTKLERRLPVSLPC